MGFQRVLVAVDGEPVAAHAADVGIELAGALGARLALVHVVDPSEVGIPDGGVPAGDLLAEAERGGKGLLARFGQNMPASSRALEFLRVGPPAAEIVRAASEWAADLIVIGSHGRRGVSRALLGSVAEAVMRHAPCPVLVVRAQTQAHG